MLSFCLFSTEVFLYLVLFLCQQHSNSCRFRRLFFSISREETKNIITVNILRHAEGPKRSNAKRDSLIERSEKEREREKSLYTPLFLAIYNQIKDENTK